MPPFVFAMSLTLLVGAVFFSVKSKHPFVKFSAHFASFLFAGSTVFTAIYLISPPKHIATLDEPIQTPNQINPDYHSSMPQPQVESSRFPTPIISPDPKTTQVNENW